MSEKPMQSKPMATGGGRVSGDVVESIYLVGN